MRMSESSATRTQPWLTDPLPPPPACQPWIATTACWPSNTGTCGAHGRQADGPVAQHGMRGAPVVVGCVQAARRRSRARAGADVRAAHDPAVVQDLEDAPLARDLDAPAVDAQPDVPGVEPSARHAVREPRGQANLEPAPAIDVARREHEQPLLLEAVERLGLKLEDALAAGRLRNRSPLRQGRVEALLVAGCVGRRSLCRGCHGNGDQGDEAEDQCSHRGIDHALTIVPSWGGLDHRGYHFCRSLTKAPLPLNLHVSPACWPVSRRKAPPFGRLGRADRGDGDARNGMATGIGLQSRPRAVAAVESRRGPAPGCQELCQSGLGGVTEN